MNSTLSSYYEPRWYAVYTRSRHEKKVAEELGVTGVNHFLPLRETVHRWKDRRKKVQVPLFSSYLFVQIPWVDRFKVTRMNGIVKLVGFNGEPAPIPDRQIEAIKILIDEKLKYDPHPYLTEGQWVEVARGPMKGVQGIIIKKKSKYRLVLSVDIIGQSVALEIDTEDVQVI